MQGERDMGRDGMMPGYVMFGDGVGIWGGGYIDYCYRCNLSRVLLSANYLLV